MNNKYGCNIIALLEAQSLVGSVLVILAIKYELKV